MSGQLSSDVYNYHYLVFGTKYQFAKIIINKNTTISSPWTQLRSRCFSHLKTAGRDSSKLLKGHKAAEGCCTAVAGSKN